MQKAMSSRDKQRNPYVKTMTLRNKSQVFHHKTDERGGSKNDERELLEQYEEELEEDFD